MSGYRPVQVTWSSPGKNYFKIGYMDDAGTTLSPGTFYDVPLSGNNRAGFIATIFTNVASYGFSMSYLSGDFSSPPVINNVGIYGMNQGRWRYICTPTNTPGTLNYINITPFTITSGTLALCEKGGIDLNYGAAATYHWTGAVSSEWEDAANWTGPCGLYPGANINDSVFITALNPPHQPTLSSAVSIFRDTISNGNILTLNPAAYLTIYDRLSPLGLSGGATVHADVLSTIEYADGTRRDNGFSAQLFTVIPTGFTYGNLVLSNRAATSNSVMKQINASLLIANSLTVWGGVEMDIDAGTTTVNGSVLCTGNNDVQGVPYNGVIYNSAATPLVMNGTYGTPTLNGTSVVPNQVEGIGCIIVSGNITVTGNTSVNQLINTAGHIININPNVILNLSSSNGEGDGISNGFSNSGIIQSTSSDAGILQFEGTDCNLPVGGGSGGTFNGSVGNRVNLIISTSPIYNVLQADSIDANITINNLTLVKLGAYSSTAKLYFKPGKTLTVNGSFANSGVLTGPGTIVFNSYTNIPFGNGSGGAFDTLSPVSVAANAPATVNSPVTINNLTVNSKGGITLYANATVNGTVTFNSGNIITGGNRIIFSPGASVTGASQSTGWINGTAEKDFGPGNTSFNFAVGNAAEYAPALLTINTVSGTVNVTGDVVSTDANENIPVTNASGIDQNAKANVYWLLSENGGGSFSSYDATFDFTNTSPGGNVAGYVVKEFNASSWASIAGTITGTTDKASSLTNFGDFEIGALNLPTITCHGNLTVNPDVCSTATITYAQLVANVTTGGIPAPTVSFSPPAGIFNSGTTPVNATVTNIHGSRSCLFDVIVNNLNSASGAIATACNSYAWNGSTFTASGSYLYHTTNSAGCDSAATLNLTINNANTSVTSVTTCDSYVWNGSTFNSSGDAVYHTANAAGCDSAATLQLTITGICPATLNIKMFLQGYYKGEGIMTPVLKNEGVTANAGLVDTIVVSLIDSATLGNNGDDENNATVASATGLLNVDGTLSVTFPRSVSDHSYYIRLNHRNTIETWSSNTILLGVTTNYDFTTSAGRAFGSNEIDVYREGVWSLFTGDINQDHNIDIYDFPAFEYDRSLYSSGYFKTDLNGDGNVDIYDFPIFDANSQNFKYSMHP